MKNETEPKAKPTPIKSDKSSVADMMDVRGVFMGAVLGMSWQLAIVVLVPVVGGYELDQHYKVSPIWIIIGVLVAVAGVVGVMITTLRDVNESMTRTIKK